ncbi:MAG TPA: T9SS type A sorting domain-containing protein [Ignavibacteriaceae bacterium]|nr:T9SS type A sorting domain-containing protein [Ignavibacteriaceae bacterium]
MFVKENIIFAGTYKYHAGGIYRSTDEGTDWEEINNGLPMWNDIQSFASNGNYLYTIEYSVGAFRSNDNGDSWELVKNGLPQYYVHATHLITNGFNIFLGGNGIYRSTNDGLDWMEVNNGLPSDAVIGAFAVFGNNIFAGTADGPSFTPNGIYLSTNNGENWTAKNDGLPTSSNIRSICIHGNNIFVGTAGNGLWYRPLSEWGELKQYKLEQNFPNPFNPTTTISFSIPQGQAVELKVFDILGNEVAKLLNEYREAGEHKVEFDGSTLTSGIYFYQLKAGGFVQTKKLVLLK